RALNIARTSATHSAHSARAKTDCPPTDMLRRNRVSVAASGRLRGRLLRNRLSRNIPAPGQNDLDTTSVRVSDLPAMLFRPPRISVGCGIAHRGQNGLPRFLNLSPEFFSIRARLSPTVFCPDTLCRAINAHQEIPDEG